MTTPHRDKPNQRPLDILGISEPEEQAYSWLLEHSGTTVSEAAQDLALTPGKTQRLFDAIEAKGLATHTPERPRRYIPASPDIALEAIAQRRREDLQSVETAIKELQERVASQRQSDKEQMVELITSREAERNAFEQMQRVAQSEVVWLIRPPVLVSRLDLAQEQDQYTQRQAQARGVHYRSIADTEFLALPGAIHRTWEDIKAGEEVRVCSQLPFKMVLADRRLAFIPLDPERLNSPSLLVRSSALLDALYALFEILWEQAVPISFTQAGALEASSSGSHLPEGAEDLIVLMAAGLNDKRIAHEMGISASTLTRRISEIMKAFNVRTRFQLARVTDTASSDRDCK
ncbi:MAG: helix-turn-helix domain-containing protein [Gammaproteobacteria bacterium]